MNEVYFQKRELILRCLARIEEEYGGHADQWLRPIVQDSVMFQFLRACEAAIDMAMHAVAKKKLGLPKDTRDAFVLLEKAGFIDGAQSAAMRRMVGFRNLAVHQYQDIDTDRFREAIDTQLDDFRLYANAVGRALIEPEAKG